MNLGVENKLSVLIYSRRGLEKWANELSDFFNKKNIISSIFSELRNFSDYGLADNFYLHFGLLANYYDDKTTDEIICRCRLLRSLDKSKAYSMINAMAYSINEMFDKLNPQVIVSLRVDSYVLDIVEREAKKRGIEYLGLWKSAFKKGYFFITSRGELINLRDKYNNVINEKDIVNEAFKAVSINDSAGFTVFKSFTTKLYYIFRSYFLLLYRYMDRDIHGYRYLTNSLTVPEYQVNLWENDFKKFVKSDWNSLLLNTPSNKKIFIALQVNPESTIDYYVNDLNLIRYEDVLLKIISHFENTGYIIFIKDHPNMFGRRSFSFLRKITNNKHVRFIPYEVSSNYILKNLDIVFTWSGTISIQAVLAKKIAVVVNPPYFVDDLYIQIREYSDISRMVQMIEKFDLNSNDESKRTSLIQLINSSLYEGDLNFINIDQNLFNSLYRLICSKYEMPIV